MPRRSTQAENDSLAYRPRASVVEDLLDNNGGGYVFHPIGPARMSES